MRASRYIVKTSASWAKREFCPEWRSLIETAEQWQYGKEMNVLQNFPYLRKFGENVVFIFLKGSLNPLETLVPDVGIEPPTY